MRYRLAVLGLAAVLSVLPALLTAPAAPAPKKPKQPEIYALIYAGVGRRTHPFTARRITDTIRYLPKRAYRVFQDDMMRSLSIISEREKASGKEGRDEWAASKFRITALEGTAVMRIEFTEGSPEEQVLIINAFARNYVEDMKKTYAKGLQFNERWEQQFRAERQKAGIKVTEEDEKIFKEKREIGEHPPLLLEEASLPQKR